jgi:hypothetical protein
MPQRSTIRYFVVPLALLSLFFFAIMLGGVFHHHAGSSDENCSLCHLNRQAADSPLAKPPPIFSPFDRPAARAARTTIRAVS